jgi:ubiquinone/menaquinone biosynthesis C-methylase UbiE
VRTDRVLQHVDDPAAAIAEARRVLRPGGLLGMAEPDWDTLVVAEEDLATSRVFARFVAGRVRNATIGRELVRLSAYAGLEIVGVQAIPVVFRQFGVADQILGLHRNASRAVEEGMLTETGAQAWLERLRTRPFLAGFTFYLVTCRA